MPLYTSEILSYIFEAFSIQSAGSFQCLMLQIEPSLSGTLRTRVAWTREFAGPGEVGHLGSPGAPLLAAAPGEPRHLIFFGSLACICCSQLLVGQQLLPGFSGSSPVHGSGCSQSSPAPASCVAVQLLLGFAGPVCCCGSRSQGFLSQVTTPAGCHWPNQFRSQPLWLGFLV